MLCWLAVKIDLGYQIKYCKSLRCPYWLLVPDVCSRNTSSWPGVINHSLCAWLQLLWKVNRYGSDCGIYLSFPSIYYFSCFLPPQSFLRCFILWLKWGMLLYDFLKRLFCKAQRSHAALTAQQELNCQQRGRVRETLWFDLTATEVSRSTLSDHVNKKKEKPSTTDVCVIFSPNHIF